MSFFKKIFGKGKSKEERAEEFLLAYNFEKAININDIDNPPVAPEVLIEVLKKLSREGKVKGRFVGKKGWFLPGDKEMFSEIFEKMEDTPIDLKELKERFGLNMKRTVIALKDQAAKFQIGKKLVFYNDKMYSKDFLKKRWRAALSNFNFTEEEITLEDIMSDLEPKELYKEHIEEWLKDPKSPVVQLKEGTIKLRADIGELIAERVKTLWEDGADEIPFSTIAESFGVTAEEAGEIILNLVNNNELSDVTIYSAEELIKRRSAH